MTDKTIFAAFVKAQAAMTRAMKATPNPHFRSKYADLGAVQDACMPALHENGFAVVQPVIRTDDGLAVNTILVHESGATFEPGCPVPLLLGKHDMQGLGSAITYARRYGLFCMAGVAPEDDDGNKAAEQAPKRHSSTSALRESWEDSVLDSLPPNATEWQKAEAYAKAIEAEFGKYKSAKGLSGAWDKRQAIIDRLHKNHNDLYVNVLDAFMARQKALTDDLGEEPAEALQQTAEQLAMSVLNGIPEDGSAEGREEAMVSAVRRIFRRWGGDVPAPVESCLHSTFVRLKLDRKKVEQRARVLEAAENPKGSKAA